MHAIQRGNEEKTETYEYKMEEMAGLKRGGILA